MMNEKYIDKTREYVDLKCELASYKGKHDEYKLTLRKLNEEIDYLRCQTSNASQEK